MSKKRKKYKKTNYGGSAPRPDRSLAIPMPFLLFALGLSIVLGFFGNVLGGDEPVTVEKQAFHLNTVCNIRLQQWEGDEEDGNALIDEAFDLCRELENKLSRTLPNSDISKINSAAGQPVVVDDERVAEVLEMGLKYSRLSGGRFDLTVGGLAELWNFSAAAEKPEAAKVPAAEAIAEQVAHVSYENLSLEASGNGAAKSWNVTLADPAAKLDLGAVAKGYIVDRVSDFLRENGVTRALVDFGGNISCIGEKEGGEPWIIAVKRPFSAVSGTADQSSYIGTVEVTADQSAVTSGTYERRFEQDGILYHHILDPATGYPCDTDVAGVTIIGPDSGECDGLSTVCLILGVEEGLTLIEDTEGYEAVFVDNDGAVHCTSGVKFTAVE